MLTAWQQSKFNFLSSRCYLSSWLSHSHAWGCHCNCFHNVSHRNFYQL